MNYNIPRIMLAAPASGNGKTTITCGLLQALLNRGTSLASFKCGPDYIDPMFHKYVLGISGGNLDSFFLDAQGVRRQLAKGAASCDMAVIEGVMGYYDGIAGIDTQASSYDIARITGTPVILVVDCKGASLSIAAVIQGFLQYRADEHHASGIQGVLLNRISDVMAERLKPEIEKLGICVVGWIPECPEMKLESRHLGLVVPEEAEKLRRQMDILAVQMERTVDLDKICAIAWTAKTLTAEGIWPEGYLKEEGTVHDSFKKPSVRIAVARDRAFCFYYQENLRLLEELGAELIMFSPMKDSSLPDGIAGVILGGGYPELCAKELSSNAPMLASIKSMAESSMPYLAECGGFLYLHDQLESQDGVRYPMAGVIEGAGFRTGRLSRFGYISLKPGETFEMMDTENRRDTEKCSDTEIKGHEFHYWDSTNCGKDWVARKPLSERSWNCIHCGHNQIAGFPHLYYPSNPAFISRWLDGCRRYSDERKGLI